MTKRRFLSWFFILVLISVPLFAGCGQTDTAAPGQGDGGKTYQPIELNFATWQPPTYPNNTEIFEPFTKEVEQKTEGRVKMHLQPGGVLVGGGETYDAVATGMVDMGFSLQSYTPGRFPLTTILEFPFMFTSSLQACKVAAELMETFPAFQEEYSEVKVIWVGTTDTSVLFSSKPVSSLDDFRGLRVRTPGPVQNDMATALGAVPVSMPYPEVYDAIQRGVVDGSFGPQCSIFAFNFHEVAQNITYVDFYSTPLMVVMNKEVWNKISPEDQAVITELASQIPQNIGELYNRRVEGVQRDMQEHNLNVITFSEEEMQKARAILEPLEEKWLDDMEAQGLPARDFYAQVKALAEKYKD